MLGGVWPLNRIPRLARLVELQRKRAHRPLPRSVYPLLLTPLRCWCGDRWVHQLARRALGLDVSSVDDSTTALKLPTGETLFCPRLTRDDPLLSRHLLVLFGFHYVFVRLLDEYQATAFVSEGMTAIDVGAELGTFSLLASDLTGPQGRVLAVEPIASNLRCLRRCVQENGLHNVEVLPVALGSKDGVLSIDLSSLSAGHSAVLRRSGRKTAVPQRRLDSLVSERGMERVDFIKIDVEGYEPEVLAGATATIRELRPVIAVAAYHLPEHRQVLPHMIQEIADDYAVYVGRVANCVELKCIAVPREKYPHIQL